MKVQVDFTEVMQWKTILNGIKEKLESPESHKEIDELLLLAHMINRINAIIERKELNEQRKNSFNNMKKAQFKNNNSEYIKQKKIYENLSKRIDEL